MWVHGEQNDFFILLPWLLESLEFPSFHFLPSLLCPFFCLLIASNKIPYLVTQSGNSLPQSQA